MNPNLTWLTQQSHQVSNLPDWWQQIKHHCRQQISLPTKKMERWKYTDLSVLNHINQGKQPNFNVEIPAYFYEDDSAQLAFIGNQLQILTLPNLNENILICSLKEALTQYAHLIMPLFAQRMLTQDLFFANVNLAGADEGYMIYIPDGCRVSIPFHVLSLIQNTLTQTHVMIIVGENSQLDVIDEYPGQTIKNAENQKCLTNLIYHFYLKKNAVLNYCKWQHQSMGHVHAATTFVTQESQSHFNAVNVTTGAYFSRDEIFIDLIGAGATSNTSGFYHLKFPHQYVDHHVTVNHFAEDTKSTMLYKGMIKEKAKAVFNGRLYVDHAAQKITAYQANHNLLLNNQAEVYSKPELEIYADDVKCKHGATTGQLDQDALFYLRSRGIAKDIAIGMLIKSFAVDVLRQIKHPGINKRIVEMIIS